MFKCAPGVCQRELFYFYVVIRALCHHKPLKEKSFSVFTFLGQLCGFEFFFFFFHNKKNFLRGQKQLCH